MGSRRSRCRKLENEIELPIPATASSSLPPSPPWMELPEDVTANILQRLGAVEKLVIAEQVCTTWRKICEDPAMWRVVDLNLTFIDGRACDIVCRCAVDRSQGQLTELSIIRFGEDELLSYVADRSSNLRRLTIVYPENISASALVEAVKKLPQLEELHLIAIRPLGAKDVEAIGISCPLLKSFAYGEEFRAKYECNEKALAVAKTMPNLHHLQLAGVEIKNEGLEAILDGCPHLESLDLYNCYGLDLQGALGERCSKQIKFLTLPEEPSYDSEDYVDHGT